MKKSILDMFEGSVRKYAGNPFLLEKTDGTFMPTTYADARKKALTIGAGLASSGLMPGEKISILSEGCNNWILSELGIFYAGCISVPLSVKLEEGSDILFRLRHAEVSAIFISSSQLAKLRSMAGQLPALRLVVLMHTAQTAMPGETTIDQLMAMGEEYLAANREEFLAIGRATGNDDYATITYTSGTTADPKGVILTHRNYTANVEQSLSLIQIPEWYRTLIILPLDHCFAHVVGFYIIAASGAAAATVQIGKTPIESLKNISLNIREVKPHFLLSVPALAKSFRKNIESSIRTKGKIAETFFRMALRTAYAYNRDGYSKGMPLLRPLVAFFDRVIMRKVRDGFGGELKFFVGGGALLDTELQRFFYAVGIPMYQGYGLSEATPVISTNSPTHHRFGSSGMPVVPLEIKILDERGVELPATEKGEIVIRGENVMAGYWKSPEATAEAIRDGWLYTGDMGYLSKDGFLYVLGRFKSLLIGSDGEKYSPEGIEETLCSESPYIVQAMLYNDQSPYTVALIVPDREKLTQYMVHHHVPVADQGRKAVELIAHQIDRFRVKGEFAGQFPERWLPAAFALIEEPFSERNGLINSTMKLVRSKVEERYHDRIEKLYTPQGKDIFNAQNIRIMQ